jgi:hypothetical protein
MAALLVAIIIGTCGAGTVAIVIIVVAPATHGAGTAFLLTEKFAERSAVFH